MRILSECWHKLPHAREDLWPILSKTDWVNRAVGLPPIRYEVMPSEFGGSSVTAHARVFGMTMSWQELPFEWIEYHSYSVRRIFNRGPIADARMGMEFVDQEGGGCRVRVFSEWEPRNVVGEFMIRRVILPKVNRDMRRLVEHVAEHLGGNEPSVMPNLARSPVNETKLSECVRELKRKAQPDLLIEALATLVRSAPDAQVSRIRPLEMARMLNHEAWDVVRLFLNATRVGLLELSWEALCPNCRSARHEPRRTLSDVKPTAHCEVCQIEYDAEFDRSVELKFSIHPTVRAIPHETYCLAGPGAKPHILAQLSLQPHAQQRWNLPALGSTVRLRSPQVARFIQLKPSRRNGLTIVCDQKAFVATQELVASDGDSVGVINPNPFPVQLTLEQIEWSPDILTAARVTNWEEFRDLFAREVISPNEQLKVSSQVIMFTDLRGSTAMYQQMGDAPAYALVRSHFDILRQCVSEGHGRLVKTIGDAVMAVFSEIGEALEAVRQMHSQLAEMKSPAGRMGQLTLKSSLHAGPCLAVNANDRIDYFGTGVNLAARMVSVCKGGDIVISQAVFNTPEAQKFTAALDARPELSQVRFRGFEEPQQVWRIPILPDRGNT